MKPDTGPRSMQNALFQTILKMKDTHGVNIAKLCEAQQFSVILRKYMFNEYNWEMCLIIN